MDSKLSVHDPDANWYNPDSEMLVYYNEASMYGVSTIKNDNSLSSTIIHLRQPKEDVITFYLISAYGTLSEAKDALDNFSTNKKIWKNSREELAQRKMTMIDSRMAETEDVEGGKAQEGEEDWNGSEHALEGNLEAGGSRSRVSRKKPTDLPHQENPPKSTTPRPRRTPKTPSARASSRSTTPHPSVTLRPRKASSTPGLNPGSTGRVISRKRSAEDAQIGDGKVDAGKGVVDGDVVDNDDVADSGVASNEEIAKVNKEGKRKVEKNKEKKAKRGN